MADITMCKGADKTRVCPHKEKCYRHNANESMWQSWFSKIPLDENDKCDMFWGEESEGIWNQLVEITKEKK